MTKRKQVWQLITFLMIALMLVYVVGTAPSGSIVLADGGSGGGTDPKPPKDTLDPGKIDGGTEEPSETIWDKVVDFFDTLL